MVDRVRAAVDDDYQCFAAVEGLEGLEYLGVAVRKRDLAEVESPFGWTRCIEESVGTKTFLRE